MKEKNIIIYLLESGIFQCFFPHCLFALVGTYWFCCWWWWWWCVRRAILIVGGLFTYGIHKLCYFTYLNELLESKLKKCWTDGEFVWRNKAPFDLETKKECAMPFLCRLGRCRAIRKWIQKFTSDLWLSLHLSRRDTPWYISVQCSLV